MTTPQPRRWVAVARQPIVEVIDELRASIATNSASLPTEQKEEKVELPSAAPILTLTPVVPDVLLCSICYEPLSVDDARMSCGHIFHRPCAVLMLQHSSSCPICRTEGISLPPIPVPAYIAPTDVVIDIGALLHPAETVQAVPAPLPLPRTNAAPLVPPPAVIAARIAPVVNDVLIAVDAPDHQATSVAYQPILVHPWMNAKFPFLFIMLALIAIPSVIMRLDPVGVIILGLVVMIYTWLVLRVFTRYWVDNLGPKLVYSTEAHHAALREMGPSRAVQKLRENPAMCREVWPALSIAMKLDTFMQHLACSSGIISKIESGRLVKLSFGPAPVRLRDVRPVSNRSVRAVDDRIVMEVAIFESRFDFSSRLLVISPEVRDYVVSQIAMTDPAKRCEIAHTRARSAIAPLHIDSALVPEIVKSSSLAAIVQASNDDKLDEGLHVAVGLKARPDQDSCCMAMDTASMTVFLFGICLTAVLISILNCLSM